MPIVKKKTHSIILDMYFILYFGEKDSKCYASLTSEHCKYCLQLVGHLGSYGRSFRFNGCTGCAKNAQSKHMVASPGKQFSLPFGACKVEIESLHKTVVEQRIRKALRNLLQQLVSSVMF